MVRVWRFQIYPYPGCTAAQHEPGREGRRKLGKAGKEGRGDKLGGGPARLRSRDIRRLRLKAVVSQSHSTVTLASPRSRNCRTPYCCLMVAKGRSPTWQRRAYLVLAS